MTHSIRVFAYKWTARNGVPVHYVEVENDHGQVLIKRESPGYGDAWHETAAKLIERAGWLPPRDRYASGVRQHLTHWCNAHGVALTLCCRREKALRKK